MPLPQHLFVSSSDGCLYDTRDPDWSSKPPLRENYDRGHRTISTIGDLKATLRNGAYAWPGGYQRYFVAGDGEALSFKSVRENLRLVMDAMSDCAKYGGRDWSGWNVVGAQENYEDNELYCAHSGEIIPAAYGTEE